MRILVVGGGAREHALVWKLAGERGVAEVICAPGNAGIGRVARLAAANPSDPAALLALAEREHIDLTVVGPEQPLELGVVDRFIASGRAIFGPTRAAAALETSKVFAKQFMARHRIPTARCRICESADEALAIIARGELGWPVVVKADGLAAGKGVVVAVDRAEADAAIRGAMIERQFGDAGGRLVLEECLQGTEASFFVIVDGRRALALPSAQDHKRALDGDRGPNTGGMGALAPSPLVTRDIHHRVMRDIVEPVLAGMRDEGREYRGFLYVGLMLTADGPRVIEFNARFGDPEAQVVLPAIEDDLSLLAAAAAAGDLGLASCPCSSDPRVGIVLASAGYPGRVRTGLPIAGLDAAESLPEVLVFHAGTAARGGRIVTSGGRVLTVVGHGRDFHEAIRRAYDGVSRISFEGMQYRRDIGRKALSMPNA
jgi:phosphoribosylamine--glycine ligase